MSLYGHTYISIDSLKRWVNSLSIDRIQSVDIGRLEEIPRDSKSCIL